LRYGRYSHTTGTGEAAASTGIHRRAPKRVPSFIVIHSFSMLWMARFGGSCQRWPAAEAAEAAGAAGAENAVDPATAAAATAALELTKKRRRDRDMDNERD
jgi:hypothetical protein